MTLSFKIYVDLYQCLLAVGAWRVAVAVVAVPAVPDRVARALARVAALVRRWYRSEEPEAVNHGKVKINIFGHFPP